jgi:hypothetical protein
VLLESDQETKHYTSLDERTAWFYEAVTLTYGMTTKTPGEGQVYIGVQKSKDGNWLMGQNSYTLHVPPNAPVEQFWAMTLYDTETRCFIDNKHEIAGLDSRKDIQYLSHSETHSNQSNGKVGIHNNDRFDTGFAELAIITAP